jgi:hypothetical protein
MSVMRDGKKTCPSFRFIPADGTIAAHCTQIEISAPPPKGQLPQRYTNCRKMRKGEFTIAVVTRVRIETDRTTTPIEPTSSLFNAEALQIASTQKTCRRASLSQRGPIQRLSSSIHPIQRVWNSRSCICCECAFAAGSALSDQDCTAERELPRPAIQWSHFAQPLSEQEQTRHDSGSVASDPKPTLGKPDGSRLRDRIGRVSFPQCTSAVCLTATALRMIVQLAMLVSARPRRRVRCVDTSGLIRRAYNIEIHLTYFLVGEVTEVPKTRWWQRNFSYNSVRVR